MTTQIAAIVLGELALLGLVIWVVAARLRERERSRAELHGRLIERFASAAELQQFLDSEGGRRLLDALGGRGGPGPAAARATYLVQAALVLGALGVALLAIGLLRPVFGGILGSEAPPALLLAATIVLALAAGLYLAARVSRPQPAAWHREQDAAADRS